MAGNENKVEYPLYDVDRKKYVTFVTEREAVLLDLYPNRRHILLQTLKATTTPVSEWDEVSVVGPGPSSASTSVKVAVSTSTPAPLCTSSPQRATGKRGAKWQGNVGRMVTACLPYRKWLRESHVPQLVWQKVSDDLWLSEHNLNYSWEQIKEKMRLMRQAFEKAKLGLRKGGQWPHYWCFVYIYDETITAGEVTLAPEGFVLNQTNAIALDKSALDKTVAKVAQTSPELNYSRMFYNEEQVLSSTTCEEEETPRLGLKDVPDPIAEYSGTNDDTTHISAFVVHTVADVHQNPIDQCYNELEILSVNDSPEAVAAAPKLCAVDSAVLGGVSFPSVEKNNNIGKCATGPTSVLKPQCDANHEFLKPEVLPQGVSATLRSPAHKKAKEGGGFRIPPRSPVKSTTPKRKHTKKDLQWEQQDTELFVIRCEEKKDTLVLLPQVPLATWKDLSKSLESMQVNKSWSLCRDKFQQMHTFFQSILPTEGMVGESCWPYYEAFCSIFEIPHNYYSLMKNNDEDNAEAEPDGRLWTPERILLLISLYKAKLKYFSGSKSTMRHDVLWAQISELMQDFQHSISWRQCKAKMLTLKQRFHKEADQSKGTGGAGVSWPFYSQMLELFEGSATLDPPYLVSSGTRGLTSHLNGKAEEKMDRSTRSRPQSHKTKKNSANSTSTSTSAGTNKYASKKQLKKTTSLQELHERKFNQTERMIDEVTKIRIGLEKNGTMRRLVYKELLRKHGKGDMLQKLGKETDSAEEEDDEEEEEDYCQELGG